MTRSERATPAGHSVGVVGLATELGYQHRSPNTFQRAMQAFGSSRPGAWFFSKTLRHLDRLVHRASKGRTSTPELLAGLPVLLVTTTGRRSGQPRTSPLIAPPIGDDLALVGTNFGQPHTPSWVLNLEASPDVEVEYRGRRSKAVARPATSEEEASVWQAAAGVYGGYAKYQQRISGRSIRVFVLEAATA
jgi:deazaflavin-dependent oxidoreductase (nitroreductase family)